MKKLTFFVCSVFLLLSFAVTANAAPVFVDNVTLTSGWIDVNKSWSDDTSLCWAASASNVLAYTGWIGTPNLSTANQIFNDYKNYWNDATGNIYKGIEWWFDGVNQIGRAQLTNTTHQGFYTQSLFNNNSHYMHPGGGLEDFILYYVKGQHGLSLELSWYDELGQIIGGHILTLWGIDIATNQLYVTDSDDNTTSLQIYAYDQVTRHLTGYHDNPLIEGFCGLDFKTAGDPDPTPRSSQSVPEPTTMLLLGFGLMGLAGFRRKLS